jgi:hypothetical protein
MPFIHVKSLPFEKAFDASAVVEGLTNDFANGTTWKFLLKNIFINHRQAHAAMVFDTGAVVRW